MNEIVTSKYLWKVETSLNIRVVTVCSFAPLLYCVKYSFSLEMIFL